jgi:hypothetical protein
MDALGAAREQLVGVGIEQEKGAAVGADGA